ncbi:hypothetical protein AQJ67_33065 [Streptomyces caeruleatus]|uniref:Uncharacterized protein n=2 Tax=Streptomyces caeruleatus TaxID=661399 RepID=A0A124I7F7_9ACTN|nr:hypothetical protein AQJ67_33065 [Streptomyces caeruleatus]
MTARTASHFTTILLGLAVLTPWLFFVASVMSGSLLWLAALNLIGTHVGLLVMLRGYRNDSRALKRWGAATHAATLLLFFVAAAILQ